MSEAQTQVPLPPDEAGRLEALRRYEILDTMPEREFDDIAFLAAQICGAPVALITFIDSHRQWFKAHVGVDITETPRDLSFCAHAILQSEPLVIPDTLQDPRFQSNPLVTGAPHIRFYSGVPLVTPDGHALGTLCVLDVKPHELSDEQQESLHRLSRQAVAQLELRRSLLGLQRAISERDAALVAQQQGERLRKAIVEYASDGILTVNEQGCIQSCNVAAAQMFDVPAEFLFGRPLQNWIIELGEHASLPDVLKFLRGGHVPELASRHIDIEDVGWSAQSVALPPPSFTVPPTYEAQQGDSAPLRLVREVALRRVDGDDMLVEWSISEMEFEGERMFIVLLRDISERRKIDLLKNEFISTVSHELRTPLTSIHGSLALLRGVRSSSTAEAVQSPFELPKGAQMLLDIACNNSDRLVRLINDILDISKIEAERMEFRLQPLDLGAFLESAIDANRAYGEGCGVRFSLAAVPPHIQVLADPDRLMQVMTNLLSNAAKFTQFGDTVSVEVTQFSEASGEASHEGAVPGSPLRRARVAVSDHGPGIREEFRDRVFQKFAQADSSNTRQKGGTGLGLSISKAIIERMGGRIGFTTRGPNPYPADENFADRSAPTARADSGTTFYFDLPEFALPTQQAQPHDEPDASQSTLRPSGVPLSFTARRQPVFDEATRAIADAPAESSTQQSTLAAEHTVLAQNENASRPRILICEDDVDVALVLRLMLQHEGFDTEIVHDGAAARALLAEQSFDAMTLDLELPDGDGIALIRKLRLREDTRDMPIVVISARPDKSRVKPVLEPANERVPQPLGKATPEIAQSMQIGGDALGVVDWLDKPVDQERLRAAVVRAVSDAAGTRHLQHKPLILHVEDDPDIIQLLSLLLSDVAQMRYAMTLQDARRLLNQEAFDLVILDLTLPDGSGLDLLPLLHRPQVQSPKELAMDSAAHDANVASDTLGAGGNIEKGAAGVASSASLVSGEPVPVVIFSAYEIDTETAQRVASVLTKSRHSHHDLLDIVRRLVPQRAGRL